MPFQQIHKSKSLPILQRKLSLVHLAPIPEVPIYMPLNPDIAKIDLLIDLLDYLLEESTNEFTISKLQGKGGVQQECIQWFHMLSRIPSILFHNVQY